MQYWFSKLPILLYEKNPSKIMHNTDPCTTRIHAQQGSMHNKDPRIHAQHRSMHNTDPRTTRIHAQHGFVHNKDPRIHAQHGSTHNKDQCTTRIHTQHGSMHNKDPCTTRIHAQQGSMHNIGNMNEIGFPFKIRLGVKTSQLTQKLFAQNGGLLQHGAQQEVVMQLL
jgi:hypothetical protein